MSTRVGIAVDAAHATVVVAHGNLPTLAVETVRTVTAPTLEGLLAAATATLRTGDPVRVSVAISDSAAATLDVTADLLHRRRFTTQTLRVTGSPGDGVTVAGYVADPAAARAGQLTTALAVTAPTDLVTRIHAALSGRHPVEVVTPALTAGPIEGVSLALRDAAAELVLTTDGAPTAARTLRAGGLSGVVALLGGDTDRLTAALTGQGGDPIAVAETDRWLRAVADECASVLAEWSRRGLRAGAAVFVHGPGAAAADLTAVLADAGVGRREDPVLNAIPGAPAHRPAVVTAYLAAATLGQGLPYAAFVDPAAVATQRRRAARARRRKQLATIGTCAALLGGAVLGPTGYATYQSWRATGELKAASAAAAADPDRAGAIDLVALTEVRTALTAPTTQSAQTVATALATTPTHVTITGLTVSGDPGDSRRTVTVSGTSRDLGPVTEWVTTLRTKLGATDPGVNVTPTTVTRTDTGLSFTLTIRPGAHNDPRAAAKTDPNAGSPGQQGTGKEEVTP